MRIEDVTISNFASLIALPATREKLLIAMRAKQGSYLLLSNHVSNVACQFETNPDDLDQIVRRELESNCEDLLRDIVFHAKLREDTLIKIYESGFCLIELAHRRNPFTLLDRIAREHAIEEAVLTLLLDYYGTDSFTEDEFIQFIRDFYAVRGLQYELKNKMRIPEAKRVIGQATLAEMVA
jgi:hypothetical protein